MLSYDRALQGRKLLSDGGLSAILPRADHHSTELTHR